MTGSRSPVAEWRFEPCFSVYQFTPAFPPPPTALFSRNQDSGMLGNSAMVAKRPPPHSHKVQWVFLKLQVLFLFFGGSFDSVMYYFPQILDFSLKIWDCFRIEQKSPPLRPAPSSILQLCQPYHGTVETQMYI